MSISLLNTALLLPSSKGALQAATIKLRNDNIAGIADGDGAIAINGKIESEFHFGFICGGKHDHIGQHAHKADVQKAVMRCAVAADKAGAVDAENNRQILQGDFLKNLVEASLEERGINADKRFCAGFCKACGDIDGNAFGDADIEKSLREFFTEFRKAGGVAHRGGDGDDTIILFGKVGKGVAEGVGKAAGGSGHGGRFAVDLKRAGRMEFARVIVGGGKAFAFFGIDVQNGRMVKLCQFA